MIFYTYMWLREDGTSYYVGKGCGQRAWRKGSPPAERVLVQEYPCEGDAFAAEVFLIAYYGRHDTGAGRLVNRTDGGDCGPNQKGFKHSEDFLRRQSARSQGNTYHLGKKDSESTIQKKKDAHVGKRKNADGSAWHLSEAARLKIAKAKTGKRCSPATEFKPRKTVLQ